MLECFRMTAKEIFLRPPNCKKKRREKSSARTTQKVGNTYTAAKVHSAKRRKNERMKRKRKETNVLRTPNDIHLGSETRRHSFMKTFCSYQDEL